MNWSPQQSDIFSWFATGAGNLVVRARAGTGKTTTILEGITHAPEETILLAAFGKDIAVELTRRLRNPRAVAKTLHSVGFGIIRRQWAVQVDGERSFRLARMAYQRHTGTKAEWAPDPIVALTVNLARVIKNTCPQGPEHTNVVDMAYERNIVPENGWADEVSVEDLASMACLAVEFSLERDGTIDFDDMVFLPVAHGWTRPTFDLIVVDEAQDMNAVQLTMAQRLARGRIAVVGDDKQAIYAFRGADSNAIDRLRTELAATELPLTITYRCPRKVVELAKPLCPDFECGDGAPDGIIQATTERQMIAMAEPTDFILSRLNAPLARICLALLRAGKPARIQGRDISKSLLALIRRMKAETIPDLLAKLHTWREREIAKLAATKRQSAQARVDLITDQVETIDALSEGLADTPELITRVETLFGDESGPTVMCSTIHRAKGKEARRVFLLTGTLYCRGKRHDQEERNIHYVGLTRAKETLVLVADEEETAYDRHTTDRTQESSPDRSGSPPARTERRPQRQARRRAIQSARRHRRGD